MAVAEFELVNEPLGQRAREICFRDVPSIVHPELGLLASGAVNQISSEPNRFANPFFRDDFISLIAFLDQKENLSINPEVMVLPGLKSLALCAVNQTEFSIAANTSQKEVIWPGEKPFELHNKYTPQRRIQELVEGGHKLENGTLIIREGDDVCSLFVLAAASLTKAIDHHYSPEQGDKFLQTFWPYIESSLYHDIFYADRQGDGLIKSYQTELKRYTNRTWKDAGDSNIFHGQIPRGNLTHLANNLWFDGALAAGSQITQRLGLDGFSQMLAQKHLKTQQRIHEAFWWEEQGCFVPVLNEGRQIQIVTNESLISLFTQTAYPDIALQIERRMLQPDMLTQWGTRTRSSDDPDFRENDTESYQRGPVWSFVDDLGIEGAEKYPLPVLVHVLRPRSLKLVVEEDGLPELTPVTRDGVKQTYHERGVVKVGMPQGWKLASTFGITAGFDNIGEAEAVSRILKHQANSDVLKDVGTYKLLQSWL